MYHTLLDFLATKQLEEGSTFEMQVIKYLIVARNLLIHKHFLLAFKILEKAEILAKEHFLFTLLHEIYNTQIEHAYFLDSSWLDDLIEKSNNNLQDVLQEQRLNFAYAKIRSMILKNRFKGEIVDFSDLLYKTVEEYDIKIEYTLTLKSLYQLISISSLAAFATKDYSTIERFLIETYDKIKNHQQREKQRFYHIQVLYHLANMYFRNKKFEQCFYYLEKMKNEMEQQRRKYYKVFQSKHQNLLALSYNYTGEIEKAIIIAEKLLKNKIQDLETSLDVQLSLAMYYFQSGKLKEAFRIFNSFYHSDNWLEQRAGKEWVLKKNIAEILLLVDMDEIELVSSRWNSFKRKHFTYLKQNGLERVVTFMNFVNAIIKNSEIVKEEVFRKKIREAYDIPNYSKEDIFVLSFFAWLQSKLQNVSLYDATLALVKI